MGDHRLANQASQLAKKRKKHNKINGVFVDWRSLAPRPQPPDDAGISRRTLIEMVPTH